MKKSLLILIPLIISGSINAQHFDWLIGTWKLKDKPSYEIWQKVEDGSLIGRSFTIKNGDTVITERIQLKYINKAYHYIPDVAENNAPVEFKITSYNDRSFKAENPEHDFPKVIKYTIVRKGDEQIMLEASIEGNGKVIPYSFVKLK
jgi:hypothetical protein